MLSFVLRHAFAVLAVLGLAVLPQVAAADTTPVADYRIKPVVLHWNAASGAHRYELQVFPMNGDGPGLDLVVSDPAMVQSGSYAIPAPHRGEGNYLLLPGAHYSWRVRFGNDQGWAAWSDLTWFSTPLPSPDSVRLSVPSLTEDTTPLIQWVDTDPTNFYYELQVSADPVFGGLTSLYWVLVHGGQSAPLNSWAPSEAYALAPGTYYTRVRPRIQATPLGAVEPGVRWSPTAAFTINSVGNSVGSRLFVDAQSNAARQAEEWRATRPQDAAFMEKIAAQPQADWFGDWYPDVESAVRQRVAAARGAGATPVLVAYNIPNRDCGWYSAGGAASGDPYRAWVRAFARGIGDGPAMVVLEPDAVGLDCIGDQRFALIRDAVEVLSALPEVRVYIDVGNPFWLPAEEAAARLRQAGVESARGFSINVSNFHHTADNLRYGRDIAARLGGKHFVIDTSRNGLGPDGNNDWCNPPGRALGNPPTTETGDPFADAFLWIKRPGESDGTCKGGPPAGAWWPEYALGLARRATF